MVDRRSGGDMALVCVEVGEESARERAVELAKKLHVPVGPVESAKGVKLIVGVGNLSLGFVDKKLGKPYHVDFLSATWKSRFHQPLGRNHIFRRALGVKDEVLSVVDATAGFGQDAVLAVSLGCKVTAVERSPVVAELLRDGVERAVREDHLLRTKMASLEIVQADAVEFLKTHTPDVVYIDPMFEKPKKTAKSPKEMQLLQELLDASGAADEAKLFDAAMAVARQRVVVKRPLKGKAIKAPSHSFKGQSIRYDVYIK